MSTSKKAKKLVSLVKKCGYLFRSEIDKSSYPDSMIDSLVDNGILNQEGSVLTVN